MIAIISDIHGNLEALQAVMKRIEEMNIDQIVCLGDVVGYGASPLECINIIKERTKSWIRGNHEAGLLFIAQDFNKKAREALEWTKSTIRKLPRKERAEVWKLIDGTPEKETINDGEILLVHGSPIDPVREYILPRNASDPVRTRQWFEAMGEHKLCFVGHSHVPLMVFENRGVLLIQGEERNIKIGEEKVIVNVGSVGQPRDTDPRACFVVLDTEKKEINYIRVEYDVHAAAEKIFNIPELDDSLGERLILGR